MNKEEYIQSLENLLIFMCKTYEDQEQILFKLAEGGNDTIFKIPRIQGIVNTVPISQIAKIKFEQPKMSFQDVKKEISRKHD